MYYTLIRYDILINYHTTSLIDELSFKNERFYDTLVIAIHAFLLYDRYDLLTVFILEIK